MATANNTLKEAMELPEAAGWITATFNKMDSLKDSTTT